MAESQNQDPALVELEAKVREQHELLAKVGLCGESFETVWTRVRSLYLSTKDLDPEARVVFLEEQAANRMGPLQALKAELDRIIPKMKAIEAQAKAKKEDECLPNRREKRRMKRRK